MTHGVTSSQSSTTSDDDTLALLLLAYLVLPVLGGLVAKVPAVQDWAVDKGLLVPADEALWVLPIGTAGLDLARIAIIGGVVVLMLAGFVLAIRARIRRRSER